MKMLIAMCFALTLAAPLAAADNADAGGDTKPAPGLTGSGNTATGGSSGGGVSPDAGVGSEDVEPGPTGLETTPREQDPRTAAPAPARPVVEPLDPAEGGGEVRLEALPAHVKAAVIREAAAEEIALINQRREGGKWIYEVEVLRGGRTETIRFDEQGERLEAAAAVDAEAPKRQ